MPTAEEREHDFLWRVHRHAPRLGEFAIFNRSHYEDVLVVRVHDLAPQQLWKERYGHIADFEELLAEHGTIVLKYFLHISKKEQKERLLERERIAADRLEAQRRTTGRSATTGTSTPRPTRTRSRRPRRRTRPGSWCRRTPSGTATW